MNKTTEWDTLEEVTNKLNDLYDQVNKTEDKQTKKNINCLIHSYEVQQKRLIIAESTPNNNVKTNRTKNDPIEILEHNNSGQQDDDDTIMSGLTTITSNTIPNNKTVMRKDEQIGTQKRKVNQTEDPMITKSQKKLYVNALKEVRGNENEDFVSANVLNETGNECNIDDTKKEIRIRFQFKGKNKGNVTKQIQLQEILYEMMTCAKMIDIKCALMPWEKNSKDRVLNGNEIKMMDATTLEKYIDVQGRINKFIDGKIYYQNGLRLKTDMDVDEFIHHWGQWKYDTNPNSPFREQRSIRRSEMQNSDTSYALGYFAGSTEKGDYTTLKQSIREITGINIELSYQTINQRGITNKIWKAAREIAEKDFPNPKSKLHKQVKFKYAPTGLVAYVGSLGEVKKARKILDDNFGQLMNNLWKRGPDGSRMRFTPILQRYITDKPTFNHLEKTLWTQATSKGGEMYLDLNLKDLYTKHDYLKNESLEWRIHNAESEKRPGLPIFKHITKKWTKNYGEGGYQVAVTACMHEEAIEFMSRIKDELLKHFGEKVRHHFTDNNSKPTQYETNMNTLPDEDIEQYILNIDKNDKYQDILIEGMEILNRTDDNIYNKQPKTNEDDTKEREKNKEEKGNNSNNSQLMLNDDMSVISIELADDTITITTTHDQINPMTNNEAKRVKTTLRVNKIKHKEIEEWKNDNFKHMTSITKETKNNEYELIKRIINEILRKRRKERIENNDNDNDSVSKLMNILTEETEKEEKLDKNSDQTTIKSTPTNQGATTRK